MPVHDGSRSDQDERLGSSGPERSQRNPEQLVQGRQSMVRSLRVQSQQLLMESQVFKDEVLAGTESSDHPAEKKSERHDHGENLIGTIRIQPFAKSFILQMYDVLARHRRLGDYAAESAGSSHPIAFGACFLHGLYRPSATVSHSQGTSQSLAAPARCAGLAVHERSICTNIAISLSTLQRDELLMRSEILAYRTVCCISALIRLLRVSIVLSHKIGTAGRRRVRPGLA